jgi:UDP-N-acetylglucosamine--N-acetylmuramyl-(pentapeptide) pyrophosphoryl-undecaprenol N-acetylglucosamine transferase
MMKILLAGGGTAGHIEPALAVARAWRVRHPEDQILFIGTEAGLESELVPAAGFALSFIPKVAIPRRLSPTLLRAPFQLIAAVTASRRLLRGVDCAIGFGGYVSGPMYFAAALTRTPFLIHEQNARPGWANRVGAHFTRHLAVSYPVRSGRLTSATLTGLPLREDVLASLSEASKDWTQARARAKNSVCKKYNLDSAKPLIFIFGGSQGSQAINTVIEEAKGSLTAAGYSIIHGVGKRNELPERSDSYLPLSYFDEMADLYLASDLIISRSGAVTCAEFQALGRYSLFIPLPIGNGEQALNAATLIEAGRAELINQSTFTSAWLTANVERLLSASQMAPMSGDITGASAVDKIVAMIERAVQ